MVSRSDMYRQFLSRAIEARERSKSDISLRFSQPDHPVVIEGINRIRRMLRNTMRFWAQMAVRHGGQHPRLKNTPLRHPY